MTTTRALVLLAALASWGCAGSLPWTSDMVETPAVHPDEELRLPPEGSLHTRGEVHQSRFEAAMMLRNPLADDEATRERGGRLFAIYCTPCHGTAGDGTGPVAKYFTERGPIDLASARARGQTDGYIYATIRDGGGNMPALGALLSEQERWAVVRFVRGLQR